jgi:predicted unusual protein kinase regulating ubiquinone biosynthesis (AarF/ABC1/UbiB family)
MAGTMATNLVRSDEHAAQQLERRHLEVAERMVEVLGTMKGAAMKLGQLASFIELDFIPEEYRPLYQEKLAALRSAAPPMEWRQVERVLSEEWDEPLASLFSELDQEPGGAASVGQVHRGVLRDGREVAVKVQYPGVGEAVRADLQNVALLTQLAKVVSPHLDARAVAGEIRERVLEELDYEWEAQMQRRFARAYRGHPFIHVPACLTELCRTRVLVSEWVDGMDFDEVKALDQDQRDRFGEIVYRFYYGSFQHLGAYNADPHPGNYLLLDDGRVAFLDYGSVKEVPRERVELMGDYSLAAAAGDAERAKVLLGELGYLPNPDTLTAERLLETVRDTKGWFLEDREIQIDPPYVAHIIASAADPRAGYFDVMRRATLPTDDVMIGRLDAGVVAVLGQLRAKRNWYRIFREWWLWPDEPPATELGEAERRFFAS